MNGINQLQFSRHFGRHLPSHCFKVVLKHGTIQVKAVVLRSHLFSAVALQQVVTDIGLKHCVSLFTRKRASQSLKKCEKQTDQFRLKR